MLKELIIEKQYELTPFISLNWQERGKQGESWIFWSITQFLYSF